ncbi:MAG TPA: hypothetical protein VN817_01030 [Solirubrobacteraceae bacterium]|nr:hypothetical protein [Solirubrobacteraceae bacterium]
MLATVERAGEARPTGEQLKRWRRAGLLPRPRLEHHIGLRGSASWYPAWAAEQLLAVVRFHRSTHRLGELCTLLWWEGHWVDPLMLRRALIAPLERFSSEAAKARGGEENPYDAAEAILRTMPDDGKPSELVKLLRGRLSARGDFNNLMWTLLVIALGGDPPWEQEDQSRADPAPTALELLLKSAGIDRAMRAAPSERPSWLPTEFDPCRFIAELRDAGGFAIEDAAAPVREASDDALAQARADALLFSQPLAMIGSVLEGFVGEDVAGLGVLGAIAPTTGFDRASLIRTMLVLRGIAGEEAFRLVAELVASTQARFGAIAELRSALPQHESLLRADYAERLAALEPDDAEQVRRDVTGYLEAHPSLAEALGPT